MNSSPDERADASQPDASVCIVNWNGREVLRNCLLSLRAGNEPLQLQTIVVDNASADDSLAMIRAEFPEVILIPNTTNRGFAAANNQAAKVATGRYLFFLNNDTVVHPASLVQLVQYLDQHPEAVAAGPKLIGSDGKPQRSGRNLPTLRAMLHWGVLPIRWTKIFSRKYRMYRNAFDPEKAGPVPQLAAAALMVRPTAFVEAEAWDEAFEFGMEDVDLCLRLAKFGTIQYVPDAHITHLGRVSSHLARGPVYRSYQCGTVRYFRKHHRSGLAALVYKIAITIDTPIRLLIFVTKSGLSRIFGRKEERRAALSGPRAFGFLLRMGSGDFGGRDEQVRKAMMTPAKKYIQLRTNDRDYHTAYIELADHPHEPIHCVNRTVRIQNLIDDYNGPGIAIDFDETNRAIGIEILYPHGMDEDVQK